VVVAGAGARGGYEAGVLSVLLPQLAAAGVTPTLFVGTSAGAINAILFAAVASLPPGEQGEPVLEVWRNLRSSQVFRPPLQTGLATGGRWVGQLARLPGVRLTSLLDTSPLWTVANTAADWAQLRANVDTGLVELAVVTTSGNDNRTVVFVDRAGDLGVPPSDDSRPIDYLSARMTPAHVLASAAIPAVFPPVQVPTEDGAPGDWYIDGGVRLNTPLKPALALDADAVVVVATHPATDRATAIPHTLAGRPPDVDDTLVRVMDAALVDRMVEDVSTLAKINVLVAAADQPDAKHTVVPFLTVGPADRGTLGLLAADIFDRRRGGRDGLRRFARDPSMRLLGRLLYSDGSRRGDLLSYLFFDPEFMEASIELGRNDAAALFAGAGAGTVPWQFGPEPANGAGPTITRPDLAGPVAGRDPADPRAD
jgi:NTE family protein